MRGAWGLPIAWNYSRKVLHFLPWPLTFPWFTTARYSDVGSQEGWLRYRQIFLPPPVQGEGLFQTFETRMKFSYGETVERCKGRGSQDFGFGITQYDRRMGGAKGRVLYCHRVIGHLP